MEAYITKDGILVIQVESSTEQYALEKWKETSILLCEDTKRSETYYFRGSKVLLLDQYV